MSTTNHNLIKASNAKKDEFYTQLSDIEKELAHYQKHLKGKVVYCNCDDPRTSNFFHYFCTNFEKLGLKRLIASCYKNSRQGIYAHYSGAIDLEQIGIRYLKGDGDFRSEENIEILKQSDILVTNPPFSLFREYIDQAIAHVKQFIVLGNQNAITYKSIFRFIKNNQLWLGVNNGGTKWFEVPSDYDISSLSRKRTHNGKKYFSMGSVMWFTNLDIEKRHEALLLHRTYSPDAYPMYDNYNAIEVSRYVDIPSDYEGVMGVPVTYLDKYNPEQFEILGSNRGVDQDSNGIYGRSSYLNGKETFKRLFIQRLK